MEITARGLAFCCQSLVSYRQALLQLNNPPPKVSNCHNSGIFLLQNHFWEQLKVKSTQEVQKHMFVETQSAIDTLCRIASGIHLGTNIIDLPQGQCTFFLVGIVYQGLSALITIGQGNPSADIRDTMTTLRWLLEHVRGRWPLAGKSLNKGKEQNLQFMNDLHRLGVYKTILDAKEAVLAAEAI